MNSHKDNPVETAKKIAGELKVLDQRIAILFVRYESGAEIRGFRVLGYPDRHKQLRRELLKYKSVVQEQLKGIERFYELFGVNFDNAIAALHIATSNTRSLSASVTGLERKVGSVQERITESTQTSPQSPPVKQQMERQVGEQAAGTEKASPSAVPIQRQARDLAFGVEVAYACRNDQHGEDSVREIVNETESLRGIVVCDGVTNANGGLASQLVANAIQSGFRQVKETDNFGAMRSQLDLLLGAVSRQLAATAHSKGAPETATTMLLAFTDNHGIYIYYIGDGTIRQFSEDSYSVGDYLLTYERGGALQGYISSNGVASRPTFLYIDSRVTPGSFLVLATDGAELSDSKNHITLGSMLRDEFAVKGKPLREVLDGYLDTLVDRTDDATLGVIWNRTSAG